MAARSYRVFDFPGATTGSQTIITGICSAVDACHPDRYLITGWFIYPGSVLPLTSFVFQGNLRGSGTWNVLNYPSTPELSVFATNLYGGRYLAETHQYQFVGNYYTEVSGAETAFGALYQGRLDGSGAWSTLNPQILATEPITGVIVHSIDGYVAVGNYSVSGSDASNAFLFNVKTQEYIAIAPPDAVAASAYGIWWNGGASYTICGGRTVPSLSGQTAYLIDWNKKTGKFSNYTIFNYQNDPVAYSISHFDGIAAGPHGSYYLTGFYLERGSPKVQAFFAQVKRNGDCSFRLTAKWESIHYPGSENTSGDSVVGTTVIGTFNYPVPPSEPTTLHGYISQLK